MSSQLLAMLKLVFVDGSTPVRSRPAVQPLSLPQYAAGHIIVDAYNSDGSPKNLAEAALFLGVRHHGTDAEPAIMLQAVIYADVTNRARFELIPGHWINVPPKNYGYDILAELYGEPDDALVVLPLSPFRVTDENVHPGDEVEVPTSQQPLAQGPKGDKGDAGVAGPQGPAGASDIVATGPLVAVDNAPVVAALYTVPVGKSAALQLRVSARRADDGVRCSWFFVGSIGDDGTIDGGGFTPLGPSPSDPATAWTVDFPMSGRVLNFSFVGDTGTVDVQCSGNVTENG